MGDRTGFATGGTARAPRKGAGRGGRRAFGLKPICNLCVSRVNFSHISGFSLERPLPGRLHGRVFRARGPPSPPPDLGAGRPGPAALRGVGGTRPGVGPQAQRGPVPSPGGQARSLCDGKGALRDGIAMPPQPNRPGLARGLGGGKAWPPRPGSSQRLNRGGIYLANKFNDQFVLVTVALPQINYSKFKYNHWLVLTHSGTANNPSRGTSAASPAGRTPGPRRGRSTQPPAPGGR